jgi:hypothetical protein
MRRTSGGSATSEPRSRRVNVCISRVKELRCFRFTHAAAAGLRHPAPLAARPTGPNPAHCHPAGGWTGSALSPGHLSAFTCRRLRRFPRSAA